MFNMYLDRAEKQVIQKYQKEILELAHSLRTADAIKDVAKELVRMTNGSRSQAISSIKIIRTAFGLGLKESKEAYDQAIGYTTWADRPFVPVDTGRVDGDDLPF